MHPRVKTYLSELGRRGGRASRRRLDSATARDMVRVRVARAAYREFHTSCFWSHDPGYRVTLTDVPWVAERLMRYGGRRGWEIGAKLCH
ncbi:MAG: hypothetical protein HYZ29_36045 [Myxococcales bacterium]|nr:hypothetical protein [Myxococcales bacterium]